jgi:SagB-type dehydrogenase family enzyme
MLPVLMIPLIFSGGCGKADGNSPVKESISIALPEPRHDSDVSLEEALLARRSIRNYSEGALTLEQLGQLLWAAQGITDPSGKRTAPSAGAIYPLEVYIVVGNVEGVSPGIYKYKPDSHTLVMVIDGDKRETLTKAAKDQKSASQAAIDIVITADYEKMTRQYGEKGTRFAQLEAGHAAQNICLQVVALKLGTVTMGYFDDDAVKKVLGISDGAEPLYIMPVGRTGA